MPRSGPVRQQVMVRLLDATVAEIDERAIREELLTAAGVGNRSEMIRIMLAWAQETMPKDWRPAGWQYSG